MFRFDISAGAMLMSSLLRSCCVIWCLIVVPTSLVTAQASSKKKSRAKQPSMAAVSDTSANAPTNKTDEDSRFKGLTWRLVGPFRGGRVLAVSGVVGEPNTYYFGGVCAGGWQTRDGGVDVDPSAA